MKYIKGDLVKLAQNGEFDVIVHGCNCFCTMGSGIALQIRNKWPQVYQTDCQTKKGDAKKLGTISVTQINSLYIVNAYTQYMYGKGKHVDYDAIKSCMKAIKKQFSKCRIGMPFIGAGLAGGDWDLIKSIIKEELKDLNITIVEFKK